MFGERDSDGGADRQQQRDRGRGEKSNPDDWDVIKARGRLKEARAWFECQGWKVLPQTARGRKILRWGCDHAWNACPSNPQRSVRNWVRRYAPKLDPAEVDTLVKDTAKRGRHWSNDQCAVTLGIGFRDRVALRFRYLGCDDDDHYAKRDARKRDKDAQKKRRRRAARSSGKKVGRPALQLSPEERRARSNALAAERMRRKRARDVTLNSVPPHKVKQDDINITGEGTHFGVTRSAVVAPAEHERAGARMRATLRLRAPLFLAGELERLEAQLLSAVTAMGSIDRQGWQVCR